ncbi:MAG: methyltransferase domain-containing protein [Acidimicrobiales bacterium]
MRTTLSADNPFGFDRFGFAFEVVRADRELGRHLDYGCFDGTFLKGLQGHMGRELEVVGVDVNEDALRRIRIRDSDGDGDGDGDSDGGGAVPCARISDQGSLPFADGSFDSISCLEVLEHVSSDRRRELLDEFRRLLAPVGVLIVSTPGRHVFSVFDLGNVKFRAPALHRLFVQARHGKAHYRDRYQENRFRLIGDVSVDAGWHEHFSHAQLAALLEKAGFEVVRTDGTGLFALPLTLLGVVLPVKQAKSAVNRLQRRDAAMWDRANVFVAARRGGQ